VSSSDTITPVAAAAASTFVQSIGVNVHMGYYWTTYNNVPLVESDLTYLGLNHVRDELLDWSNVQTNYQQLAADGIKFDFLLPTYAGSPNTTNLSEFISMVDALVKEYPGSVSAIEGSNEVNIWPVYYDGGTTLADDAALQQALDAAVRADPNLNGIPVYNITLGGTVSSQFQALGNLSASANYANSHAYPNDEQSPQVSMSIILPYAEIDAPGLPIVITETGYETNPADGYSGADQTVQAKYTLDILVDAFLDGVSQTYLYELFDEGGQNFGLFNTDGTPKLVATAIHNLTTLLADPGSTSAFTPGSLSYAIPNLPGNGGVWEVTGGQQLLLEKSNGTFDLVLWTEPVIWNSSTESEIAAPIANITVDFATTQKTVLIFDPLLGSAPIAAYLNVESISVALTDHPVVVEIPGTTATLTTPTITGFTPNSGSTNSGILTGMAVANSTVLVFDGTTEIGTANASGSGAWSFSTGTLAQGTNALTAMAVDTAGDVSSLSSAFNVTNGAAGPAAPNPKGGR
jgi:trimeric autotransporter adhesin